MTNKSKLMKIFIVTSGEYSDYGINAVFSTEEKAKAYIGLYPNERFEIEEWNVDEDVALINKIRNGEITLYAVRMLKDGNVEEIKKEESSSLYQVKEALVSKYAIWNKKYLCMYVIAKHENHAIKIVNEKRIQLIANNEWNTKA